MNRFFEPRSVAVIGASNSPFNLGASICKILQYLKYHAAVYAVNRNADTVCGCPGFSSVLDIPGEVDLAVIITPARAVPGIARECGEKGIRRIVIESAGFSEEGEGGSGIQRELDEAVRRYGIRYLGPNCLGVLNTHNRFCCFFGIVPGFYAAGFERPGTVSYIIQSGGVGALVLDTFQSDVVNANKVVSIGNMADIDEADILEYLGGDNTEVIGMYLENIRSGRKFMEAARRVKKPIMVYKVGRTAEGAVAAMSHTSGMANNDIIFDHACRQAGVIRLEAISELHSLPKIFTSMPLLAGKRIAVFTNSGAFGGITSDLLIEAGLEVPCLSPDTQERLRKTGKLYNVSNPIDLGPALSKQTFLDIFDILLSSDEVDGLLPVPNVWQEVVIEAVIDLIERCRRYNKPAAIYIPNAVERIIAIRSKYQIPVFESPEEAVRALAVSHQYFRYLGKKESDLVTA